MACRKVLCESTPQKLNKEIEKAFEEHCSTTTSVLQYAEQCILDISLEKLDTEEPWKDISVKISRMKYAAVNLKFQYRCLCDEIAVSLSKKMSPKFDQSVKKFVEKCKTEKQQMLELKQNIIAFRDKFAATKCIPEMQIAETNVSKSKLSKEKKKQAKKALKAPVENVVGAKERIMYVTAHHCPASFNFEREIAGRLRNVYSYKILASQRISASSYEMTLSCYSKRSALRMIGDLYHINTSSPVHFECFLENDPCSFENVTKAHSESPPAECTSTSVDKRNVQLKEKGNSRIKSIGMSDNLVFEQKIKHDPSKLDNSQAKKKNEQVVLLYERQSSKESDKFAESESNKKTVIVKQRKNEKKTPSTGSKPHNKNYSNDLGTEKDMIKKTKEKRKNSKNSAYSLNTTSQDKKAEHRKKTLLYLMCRNFLGTADQFEQFVISLLPKSVKVDIENKMMLGAQGKAVEVYLTLCFETKHAALQSMNCLKISNKSSQTKLVCSMQPISSLTPEAIEKRRLEIIDSTLSNMVRRAEEVIMENQLRVESIQTKVEDVGRKIDAEKNARKRDNLENEKKELVDEQAIMMAHRSEFQLFLGQLCEKLEKSRSEVKFEQICQSVKKEFGIECIRMENPLPIYSQKSEIISMVKDNQVSIILAETGSGKSTQVVQYIREANQVPAGMIVCTQPRKIAAISVATRVALELGTNVGHLIGYKVGMHEKRNASTEVLYMTDHSLLLECLKDKDFRQFSHIIIDEAHERSVFTDLLLGIIKKCLNKRPDLRVIITSATIDPKTFCDYFDGKAALMRVGGRTFPVEVEWTPDNLYKDVFDDYLKRAVKKALEVHESEPPGDILVFLTSALEIERACAQFLEKQPHRCIVLPLHGSLQSQEQQSIFKPTPTGVRKVIFATNIAETSVTIPGIKYVVDTGVVKEMNFNHQKQMNILAVTQISKSSAEQRKGRAGRMSAGKCFRLYSEESYQNMINISNPEILRIHLSHVMIKLLELDVNPLEFDYVISPSQEAITNAMVALEDIGAIEDGKLTEFGKNIGKLNIEPRLGAFVLKCLEEKVGVESIVIAAANSSSQIFFRAGSENEKLNADKKKVPFCDMKGDIFTLLNVFREWHKQPEHLKGRWCYQNSINGKSMKTIRETANEIMFSLKKQLKIHLKFEFHDIETLEEKLMLPLLKTYKKNIGHFLGHAKAGYLRCETMQTLKLHPSSAFISLAFEPKWIFFQNTMQTTQDFAMNATAVPRQLIVEAVESGFISLDIESIEAQALAILDEKPVGTEVFKAFVGFRFENVRQMEENLKASLDSLVIIDSNRTTGLIKIWSEKVEKDQICQGIENSINEIKLSFKNELLEQPVSNTIGKDLKDPGVRVAIGQGAQITNIYMPNEYKSVLVFIEADHIDKFQKDDVTSFLQDFGKIQDLKKFFRKKNNPSLWGIVTFSNTEDAVKAVEFCKKYKCDIVAKPTAKPDKINYHGFRAKIQWCRRKSKGLAFVDFREYEDALRILRQSTLLVGRSNAKICTCRNSENTVRFLSLDINVTEDVLRDRILNFLGIDDEGRIQKIKIPREKVNTTKQMVDSYKVRLQRAIREFAPSQRFRVEIFDLRNENDTRFMGFVSFDNPDEGVSSCKNLSNSLMLNDAVVTMKPNLVSSISVKNNVFEMIKEDIEMFKQEYEKDMTALRLKDKELKNGLHVIELTADSIDLLVEAKRGLHDIIKGDTINFTDPDACKIIFSFHGRQEFEKIMKNTNTLIIPDHRNRICSLYGCTQSRTNAKIKLNEYLNKFLSLTTKSISLKGDGLPPGVLKAVLTRFGLNLEKLCKDFKLSEASINVRSHCLLITGEKDSVQKAEEEVNKIAEMLPGDITRNRDTIDCIACFTPIEDLDTLYRFEACGHPFDTDCLKLFLQSSIETKSFPMKCACDGCDGLLLVRDLNNIQRMGLLDMPSLVNATLGAYIAENNEEYHYCITPDCSVVYRVTKEGEMFVCPECSIRICTSCHVQFHDGITCRMYQNVSHIDDSLERWIRKNESSRKICPNCGTPIEKISGCNKMYCSGCKKVFCWLCGEIFSNEQECYKHLQKNHGGFGDEYPL